MIARERRMDGDSFCENKHKFKSTLTIPLVDKGIQSNAWMVKEMKQPSASENCYLESLLWDGAQRIELLEKDLAEAMVKYRDLESRMRARGWND